MFYLRFKVKKRHYFPHTVHYCCSSNAPPLKRVDFYKAHRSEKRGSSDCQLSSALWLAECLKRETEMLRPSPYCDAVSRRDETKTIKPITNEAFVASSGDIITDYNDLDFFFTHRVASRLVNITMSAFVIGEKTNNKHYSTPLKTRVWIVRSRNVLTGFESEAPDCPCKVGIAPLYRNSLCASKATLLPGSGNSPPWIAPHTLEYLRCTALEQCCKYNLTTDF